MQNSSQQVIAADHQSYTTDVPVVALTPEVAPRVAPEGLASEVAVVAAAAATPSCSFSEAPTSAPAQLRVNVRIYREPVLVYGRYIKLSRRLSQTPWVVDGKRKGVSSVEEALAGPVLARFRPTTFKFHSSGREDFNVRMCGNGRPFILELLDATIAHASRAEYAALEEHMNSVADCPTAALVRVNSLRAATVEYDQVKQGAETKRKSYRFDTGQMGWTDM